MTTTEHLNEQTITFGELLDRYHVTEAARMEAVQQLYRAENERDSIGSVLENEREQHAAHLHRITERLHREADDRQFCSEFDDIMTDIGLPRRKRSFSVVWEVVARVEVKVEAEDADQAYEDAYENLTVHCHEFYPMGQNTAFVTSVTHDDTRRA